MQTTSTRYWDQTKEKLKEKWPVITEEDLRFQEGKEREMMEMLGYKLGKTKEELLYIIAKL
jgi:hypothetical protein